MQEIMNQLLDMMESFDSDNPATLRQLSELLNLADSKLAKVLKKMRVQGIIAFTKEETIVKEEVKGLNKSYKRDHPLECFHYWGLE